MSVQRATISAQRMLPDRSAGVLTRKPVTGYVFPFSCPIAKDSAVCTALVPPPSGLFRGRPIARGFFPSRVFPSALGLGNRNISGYGLAIGGFFLLNHPHLIFAGRHIYAGAEAAHPKRGCPEILCDIHAWHTLRLEDIALGDRKSTRLNSSHLGISY